MPPTPRIRDRESIEYESVDAAEGLRKGVLLDESDGAPTFALRRFTLEQGASVPRHTNEVEHVQYVLAGEYVVGIEGAAGGVEVGRADSGGARDSAGEEPDDLGEQPDDGLGDPADDDLDQDEYRVRPGDSLLVPAGTVHWYRNDGDARAAFLCGVPHGPDEIELVE